jgi:hypothetical protein
MINLEQNSEGVPLQFVSPHDGNGYLVDGNWFAFQRWCAMCERSRVTDPDTREYLSLLIESLEDVLAAKPAVQKKDRSGV